MLVLMPLQFGSSIFATPTTMPGWLEGFTKVNPLSNLADAARGADQRRPVAHSVWITLAWAVGITRSPRRWRCASSARRPDARTDASGHGLAARAVRATASSRDRPSPSAYAAA